MLVKPAATGFHEGVFSFRRAVDASQPTQLAIVETLHSHAQPVHAHFPQCGKMRLVHRAGIRFARDFGIGQEVEGFPAGP